MDVKNYKQWLFLVIIVFLGLLLRIYRVDEIPGSLSPDEAALGYNAYSLLKTGADEHGVFFPLSLQSFGDWKLPGYPFFTILPVMFFGLTDLAIRLPSVIAGVISVILVYLISLTLFRKQGIALLSAFFMTVSPWSIYFSRAAYEVNVATTLFLAGFLIFVKFFYENRKYSKMLIVAAFLFGLTIFTYHSYAIFLPLFLALLFILLRKQINLNYWVVAASIIFILFFGLFNFVISRNGSNKISTLVIFNDPNILYSRVEKLRGDMSNENELFKRIVHNKYLGVSYQLAQNYINSFNPVFLFDKGGEKLQHNLGTMSNLYLIDALFLFIGLLSIFWHREKSLKLLIAWIIIAPIPSIITKDTPNSTRLFTLMPVFTLIASYGVYQIINYYKKNKYLKYIVSGLVFSFYALNVLFFLDGYFIHFNMQRVRFWHYGYREAVLLAQKYPDHDVVMTGPENFPYIYFLFYNSYDPSLFRKEVVYYPPTNEGFYFVEKFGRYSFVSAIDYTKIKENTLYIDATRLDDKNHSIFLPSGEPIFGYYVTDKKK